MGYLAELLLNETSVEDLKKQWVDSKKMSPEQFDTVCQAANNKSSWVTWLGKRVLDKQLSLKPEDVTKWQEVINLFERYKQKFTYKDINQVKTRDQISQFVNQALDLKSQAQAKDVATKAAKDQFAEFYKGSVEVDGKTFKVYVLPKGRTDLYKVSRAIAGDTHWCTASSDPGFFEDYIKTGDLTILINSVDPKEKYQLHPDGSLMDRTDTPVEGKEKRLILKALNMEEYEDIALSPEEWLKDRDGGLNIIFTKSLEDFREKLELTKNTIPKEAREEIFSKVQTDVKNHPDADIYFYSPYSNNTLERAQEVLVVWVSGKEIKVNSYMYNEFSDEVSEESVGFKGWKSMWNYGNDIRNAVLATAFKRGMYDRFADRNTGFRRKGRKKLNEAFNLEQKQRLQYLAGILK